MEKAFRNQQCARLPGQLEIYEGLFMGRLWDRSFWYPITEIFVEYAPILGLTKYVDQKRIWWVILCEHAHSTPVN